LRGTKPLHKKNDESIGDAYCFVVLERNTKLVLNFALGGRNQATCDAFEGLLPPLRSRHLGDFEPGDELEVDFQMECWLTPQQYTLTVATQNADGSSHDWLDDAVAFEVVDTRTAAGVANLRAQVAWRVLRHVSR
jgi:hypothetical protein